MKSLVATALLLAACESPFAPSVRARAADDFGCKDDDVQVLPAAAELQFVARGCGHKATYVCTQPKDVFKDIPSCAQLPAAASPAPSAPPMAASVAPASSPRPNDVRETSSEPSLEKLHDNPYLTDAACGRADPCAPNKASGSDAQPAPGAPRR